MAKRKTIYPGDNDSDYAMEDVPGLSKTENDAWGFFQDPECSTIVELFAESRFRASSSSRVVKLLDDIQPHIVSPSPLPISFVLTLSCVAIVSPALFSRPRRC
jgi:hypothetical protein